jgi:hypothetical protein
LLVYSTSHMLRVYMGPGLQFTVRMAFTFFKTL